MKVAFLSLVCLVAGPALAAATPDTAAVDSCVKTREKLAECKEQYIDSMIALRAKYQPQTAEAIKTPEGAKKVHEIGVREAVEDGTGPLAPRQKKCMEMTAGKPASPEIASAMAACGTEPDCAKRVACYMPLMEKVMFGEKKK